MAGFSSARGAALPEIASVVFDGVDAEPSGFVALTAGPERASSSFA
jgi:hypothetical protein